MGFSSQRSSAAAERCDAELAFELRKFPDCAAFSTQIPRDDFVIEDHTSSASEVFIMLVARRDPFHPAAHDAAYSHKANAAGRGAPRLARTVNMLQVVGSLLAIPVGLASAYSIYRANFSVETTCQSLRSDIISMIDKRVDASTRRILARRDVEKFEQSCGAIDPDATAAFKDLLAADKPAAPVVRLADAAPAEPVRKADPPPQVIAKLPAAWPRAAAAEPVRRDRGVSDTQWLDAVRQALLTHGAEPPRANAAPAPVAPAASSLASRPSQRGAVAPVYASAVAAPAQEPIALPIAPALPFAASVAMRPALQADAGHPVPPAAIPDPAYAAAAEPVEHRSLIGRWVARVPLLGPVWENGRD
jgi:hypothetical protein